MTRNASYGRKRRAPCAYCARPHRGLCTNRRQSRGERAPATGERAYAGPVMVRVLPPGFSYADLADPRPVALRTRRKRRTAGGTF